MDARKAIAHRFAALASFARFVAVAALTAFAGVAPLGAQEPVTAREQLNAVVWAQRSAEARAVALATYRAATAQLERVRRERITASVEQERSGGFLSKRPAVVLDIDETVLDNSPYNAWLVREGHEFDSASWDRWVRAKLAAGIPGAREFIARARALTMRVVYITNRECNRAAGFDAAGRAIDCPQKPATIDNLERVLGYRPADTDVLVRNERQGRDDSDKVARRIEVARTHRIAMLVGDDLRDFIATNEYVPETHGPRWNPATLGPWFALPNAIYGGWERPFPTVEAKYAAMSVWQPGGPAAGTLRVVTWNAEWLTDLQLLNSSGYWTQCAAQNFPNKKLRSDLPFCDVYSRDGIRDAQAYETSKLVPVRQMLAQLATMQTDVIAFQEVNAPGGLQAVLPAGYRVACFTMREDAQNVGYAVRDAAALQVDCREIASLALEDEPSAERPVRRGLEIRVRAPWMAPGASVTLLNVHLKSSCPTGRLDRNNGDCKLYRLQVPRLETWIEERALANEPFAIVGDWNRDIEDEIRSGFPARTDGSNPASPVTDPNLIRNLWPEINDLEPGASAMRPAQIDRTAASGAVSCHKNLDQIGISVLLQARLDPATLQDNTVPARFLPVLRGASDHCPVAVEFGFR